MCQKDTPLPVGVGCYMRPEEIIPPTGMGVFEGMEDLPEIPTEEDVGVSEQMYRDEIEAEYMRDAWEEHDFYQAIVEGEENNAALHQERLEDLERLRAVKHKNRHKFLKGGL